MVVKALLLMALARSAYGQQLPNAPTPPHDEGKPFAVSAGLAQRWHTTVNDKGIANELTLSLGVTWAFNKNTNFVGVYAGYVPENSNRILTVAFSDRLFTFGRRK